jgi:PemK-like, MazF-like toxin of type II toxin-antitoxin system
MTTYQAGDLVLATYPFTGGGQSKVRPALVMLDIGDADALLARVTTQPHGTPYDVTLTGWRQAGLRAPSVVRVHKLAAVEKAWIIRILGHIAHGDRLKVATILQQTFGSW